MIASRYAGLALVLLAVTAIPVVAHNYVGWTVPDVRSLEVVVTVPNMGIVPTATRRAAIGRMFHTTEWSEQRYKGPAGTVSVFLIRSFDAKRLYHHPELGLLHGRGFARAILTRVPDDPEMPVRVLTSSTGVAAYTLVYGSDVIENPLVFQLKQAGSLLFSSRHPMTLVLAHHVYDTAALPTAPGETLAARVAVQATRAFLGQRAGAAVERQ